MAKTEASTNYSFFSSFPSQEHVGSVCGGAWMKSFASTYRADVGDIRQTCPQYSYSTGDSGEKHYCNKNGWHGRPELAAKCEGVLGFVIENKTRLIGNAVSQGGGLMPSSVPETEGMLRDISIEDGIVHVIAGDASVDIPEKELLLSVTSTGIIFSEKPGSEKPESERILTVVSYEKPQDNVKDKKEQLETK